MAFQNSLAILDVGHGNSAVIHDAGTVVVVDAGRRSALLEFLDSEKIDSIDVVLVSHADADHIGGLIALLSSGRFAIGEVRLNTDSIKDSNLWDDVLWTVDQLRKTSDLKFQPSLTVADSGVFDTKNIGIEVLGPSPYLAARGPGSVDKEGRRITHNTISAVIRITVNDEPIALLTGDLDEVGLEHLEAEGLDTSSRTLVFPHHGGNPGTGDITSFTERLLNMVGPKTVIFSIGRNSAHQFPKPEIVALLKARDAEVRIICTQLSKHCAQGIPTAKPSHLVGFAMGGEQSACCGGTIIIPFDNIAALSPDGPLHQEFIREFAPQALCAS